MKISELISLLEKEKKEHGDLEVVVHDFNINSSEEVTGCELIEKMSFVSYTKQIPSGLVLNLKVG